MARRRSPMLIAVELGGDWPSWMVDFLPGAPRQVLAQRDGEPPDAFAERVAARPAGQENGRSSISAALVICNERTDDRQMAARRQIARELGARAHGSRAELVFCASSRSGGKLRHALSSLVAELGASLERPVNARVRFGRDRNSLAEVGSDELTARVA